MTYQQLEDLYREGKATMPVDHINHREFVFEGVRYFAGYSSQRDPTYKGPKTFLDAPYKVMGWCVYKQEAVTTKDK